MSLKAFLISLWDGFLLRCPSCKQGRIYKTLTMSHKECQTCGAPFEREGEGDFLGAITVAYAVTSVLAVILIFVFNILADISLQAQLWIASVFAVVFLVLFYRNMRGMWIAVLIALLKWKR